MYPRKNAYFGLFPIFGSGLTRRQNFRRKIFRKFNGNGLLFSISDRKLEFFGPEVKVTIFSKKSWSRKKYIKIFFEGVEKFFCLKHP